MFKPKQNAWIYPISARPLPLLSIGQCLICSQTSRPDHCMLEFECIYTGPVDMFVTKLVEIDQVFSLQGYLQTYRQTLLKKHF